MRNLAVPAVLLLARLASAGTWYVDASLATGANDGTSWANAFQGVDGLQSALATAIGGDQIWVAGGTYKPTSTANRAISFELQSTVEMYGGFAGGETLLTQRNPVLNTTTLSGDLAGDDGSASYGDNSYHVIHATFVATSTLVDGFVITGGNADGGGTNQDRGGGIQLDAGSNAIFRACVVIDNRCSLKGGGVHSWNSSPVFESVRFESNLGGSHASLSAGFVAEAATNPSSFVSLDRCTFLGNTGGGAGGALINVGSVQLTNCLLTNNTATGANGAGALASISGGSANLDCCTIVANTSTSSSAGGLLSIGSMGVTNSIVYFNSGAGGAQGTVNQIRGISVTPSAAYSCVQGGYTGTGNISADPQLPGTGVGDFGLAPTSPCIDAGSNAMIPFGTTVDLAGHARRIDVPSVPDTGQGTAPICDMGCLEHVPSPFTSICWGDGSLSDHTTPCPCGNNGVAGHGCANSFEADGAVITATGTPAANDVVLESNGTPGTSFTLFQQHDALDDRVLHDGVLCAGGNLVRLRGRSAVGGQAFFPNSLFAQDQTLTLSQRGGVTPGSGAVRYYSAWYRNASSTFCPPATANVTNGISVTW